MTGDSDSLLGQIVYSKAGRDKGRYFVVIDKENSTVYLADGGIRKIERPKKKNLKHIQLTKIFLNVEKRELSNKEIRRTLENFWKGVST